MDDNGRQAGLDGKSGEQIIRFWIGCSLPVSEGISKIIIRRYISSCSTVHDECMCGRLRKEHYYAAIPLSFFSLANLYYWHASNNTTYRWTFHHWRVYPLYFIYLWGRPVIIIIRIVIAPHYTTRQHTKLNGSHHLLIPSVWSWLWWWWRQ